MISFLLKKRRHWLVVFYLIYHNSGSFSFHNNCRLFELSQLKNSLLPFTVFGYSGMRRDFALLMIPVLNAVLLVFLVITIIIIIISLSSSK